MDDIKFADGNEKRAALENNRWLPVKGEKLQIPYEIDNGHPYARQIESAIKSMNGILHCHQQAWVKRNPAEKKHYVKFIHSSG